MSSYQAAPGQPVPQAEDPGRTLAIVGLILAILFNIVGLIISIVARVKSSKAGYKNGIALAGIIIGIITTIGAIIGITAIVLIAGRVADQCQSLGSGTHVVNGVTYTCP